MSLKKILSAAFLPLFSLCFVLAAPSGASAKAVEGVVNVNTATAAELTMLPGIGKVKAEQIIQQRQSKPFASIEELKSIPGLGAKRFEAMRPHLVTEGATTAKSVSAPKQSVAPAAAPTNPQG
ncbi:MAG TPA: competence protein ComEA [Deltaproteobacteria bacterium]|nr:competence protein ComEA [Deltaproteobacteria bacterium]